MLETRTATTTAGTALIRVRRSSVYQTGTISPSRLRCIKTSQAAAIGSVVHVIATMRAGPTSKPHACRPAEITAMIGTAVANGSTPGDVARS